MLLPNNCKRITPEQRTISSEACALKSAGEPYFAVYHESFIDILGAKPTIELVLKKDYPFAHEAGVYLPEQDAIYITSNLFRPAAASEPTIWVNKVERQKDGSWTCEKLETGVTMGNGAVNYGSNILFCDQGSKDYPGGLVLLTPTPPFETRSLIDGYHGRLFNSPNDVVVHNDGSIWFTDPIYGYEQGFRNKPQLPSQIYRFDVTSGEIRVVADNFQRPNGLCFSPCEKVLYITDTDWIHGDGTTSDSRVSTIYAFDIIERNGSSFVVNRRVFAMADNGVPDGIKCDINGNVYSGCGDGVNVWNSGGVLLGKIVIPGGVANFCFTKKGELVLLNESRLWVATVEPNIQGALLSNMGISVK